MVNRIPRCPDAFDCQSGVIQLAGGLQVSIFNGKAGDACFDHHLDFCGQAFRISRKTRLKVGIDRKICALIKCRKVFQQNIDGDGIVRTAHRPREAAAGCRDSLETKVLQDASTPNVPWVRQDEATRLM